MHVFIITQYFPPEIGASASRWGDYTDILIRQNHKVTILCETPHYPNENYFSGYILCICIFKYSEFKSTKFFEKTLESNSLLRFLIKESL